MPRPSVTERFEHLVQRNPEPGGCDLWIGGIASTGYPNFWLDGTTVPAYRAAWRLFVGPIPEKQVVRHKCRNPCCVKLSHLELGTHAENEADKVRDGTLPRGESHHWARLTEADVLEAQRLYLEGGTFKEIAPRFGVHPDTLYEAAIGHKNWRHLPKIEARGFGPRPNLFLRQSRRPYRGRPPKLSNEQVAEIRQLYVLGVPKKRLARQFDVSPATIRRYVREPS